MSRVSYIAMDTTSSSSLSSGHESTEVKMKKVIEAIGQYLNDKSPDAALTIKQYLQSLSVTLDIRVFDPHTNCAANFFLNLYELMNRLDPISDISWNCVDLLINVCKNSSARKALIKNFHFIPPLSRLLYDHLSSDQKIKILRLMQDLSSGIRISWQIPNLHYLMSTLTKWVQDSLGSIVDLSLGVLSNLCFRNIPAIYTLYRCVDIKKFLRCCTEKEHLMDNVHIYKLIAILDYNNGEIPAKVLIRLTNNIFKEILKEFELQDAIILRQLVEHFLEIRNHSSNQKVLNNYEDYEKYISSIIQAVERKSVLEHPDMEVMEISSDPECVAVIFELISSLLQSKLESLEPLHGSLINLALQWVQTEIVAPFALAILYSISTQTKDVSTLNPIISKMPIILSPFNIDLEIRTDAEFNKSLASLLELLRSLVAIDEIRDSLLKNLKHEMLWKVFSPLIGDGCSPRLRSEAIDVSSNEAIVMYVNALSLLIELAKIDVDWFGFSQQIITNKEVHMILGQALYHNSKDVKRTVLYIIHNINFPCDILADVLSNLQVPMGNPDTVNNGIRNSFETNIFMPNTNVYHKVEEVLIEVKNALSTGMYSNISTSEVVELYEYKLASISHSERAALTSAEAASQRCVYLQHLNTLYTTELRRLQQLFFHTQQCSDEALRTVEKMKADGLEITKRFENEKHELVKVLDQKVRQLNDLEANHKQLQANFDELMKYKEEMEKELNNKVKIIEHLKENAVKYEKNISFKEEENRNLQAVNKQLKREKDDFENKANKREATLVAELEMIRKERAKTEAALHAEVEKTKKELEDATFILGKIREFSNKSQRS